MGRWEAASGFGPFLTLECAGLFDVPAGGCARCRRGAGVRALLFPCSRRPAGHGQRRVCAVANPRSTRHSIEWTAILAGDALLTLAFELLASPNAHADASVRTELLAGLARAAGAAGMAGGQCIDLEADKLGEPRRPDLSLRRSPSIDEDRSLLCFACEAGAILGGADFLPTACPGAVRPAVLGRPSKSLTTCWTSRARRT